MRSAAPTTTPSGSSARSARPRCGSSRRSGTTSLREGGRVLAVETDKALRAISPASRWAVYIQGDEVLHEDGLAALREAMQRWRDDRRVDGLLLDYRHFYGSYDYLGAALRWYRREVRVVRNDPGILLVQRRPGVSPATEREAAG